MEIKNCNNYVFVLMKVQSVLSMIQSSILLYLLVNGFEVSIYNFKVTTFY